MIPALDTSGVPQPLAEAMWPWIDIVEMATGGMGGRVRRTAENTVATLRGWIAMTPSMEQALDDALHTSDALAYELDLRDFLRSDARTEALLALNVLITLLRVEPNG